MSEVTALCEALKHALGVAQEQQSPAYVSVEAGDYHVGETDNIVGRQLCTVDQNGEITWNE